MIGTKSNMLKDTPEFKIDKILKELSNTDTLYSDESFPPTSASLCADKRKYDESYSHIVWKRATEIGSLQSKGGL